MALPESAYTREGSRPDAADASCARASTDTPVATRGATTFVSLHTDVRCHRAWSDSTFRARASGSRRTDIVEPRTGNIEPELEPGTARLSAKRYGEVSP